MEVNLKGIASLGQFLFPRVSDWGVHMWSLSVPAIRTPFTWLYFMYIRAHSFLLYPYTFVAGPSKHNRFNRFSDLEEVLAPYQVYPRPDMVCRACVLWLVNAVYMPNPRTKFTGTTGIYWISFKTNEGPKSFLADCH